MSSPCEPSYFVTKLAMLRISDTLCDVDALYGAFRVIEDDFGNQRIQLISSSILFYNFDDASRVIDGSFPCHEATMSSETWVYNEKLTYKQNNRVCRWFNAIVVLKADDVKTIPAVSIRIIGMSRGDGNYVPFRYYSNVFSLITQNKQYSYVHSRDHDLPCCTVSVPPIGDVITEDIPAIVEETQKASIEDITTVIENILIMETAAKEEASIVSKDAAMETENISIIEEASVTAKDNVMENIPVVATDTTIQEEKNNTKTRKKCNIKPVVVIVPTRPRRSVKRVAYPVETGYVKPFNKRSRRG